jgi:hypothetical protein
MTKKQIRSAAIPIPQVRATTVRAPEKTAAALSTPEVKSRAADFIAGVKNQVAQLKKQDNFASVQEAVTELSSLFYADAGKARNYSDLDYALGQAIDELQSITGAASGTLKKACVAFRQYLNDCIDLLDDLENE